MKLSKLEITNFRCFESIAIDLQPDINVIVGANGAGKSSILDSVAIALYELVAANGGGGKRQRALQRAALLPTDIRVEPDSEDVLTGRKEFVQFRATATSYYAVADFPTITPSGETATLEWTEHIRYRPPAGFFYDTSASGRLSDIHRYFQTIWQEIQKSSSQALIPLPVVAYYRAHRRIGGMPELGDIFKLDLSRGEAFANALDAGADFRAMCQWFYLRENAELRTQVADQGKGQEEFPDLRAVRHALNSIIEGVERIYFDGNPPRLMVDLRESSETMRSMELAQLSDGYRNLLALVLDFARRLAQANPSWPNPLEAPGILVIDEIELHLHPRWQQTVIPSLHATFPNTQIIVSTHSPAVLTTVKHKQIHLLGSDHKFEIIPDDVGTYGAESSRVLAEVFGTHARPPMIDSVEKLRTYLALIEAREHDTMHAQELRTTLEEALGSSDPDLRRADIRIAQLKIIGKR